MWTPQPQKSICRRLLLCQSLLLWLKYSTWHRDAGRQEVQHTGSIWNDWLQWYRGFTYHWIQTNYMHLFFIITDPFSTEPFKCWCQAYRKTEFSEIYFLMPFCTRRKWLWNWKYLHYCTLHFILIQALSAILFFHPSFLFPHPERYKKIAEHLFSYLYFVQFKLKKKNSCWPRHINYTIT